MTTCQHCKNKTEFTPKRSTARFCGPTCRVAGHRRPRARFLALQPPNNRSQSPFAEPM